jgi:RNA polymerase sigma-70 factor (ECF subfamily)
MMFNAGRSVESASVVTGDDAACVEAAQAGSASAFEKLVSRYENRIYRLGLIITCRSEEAEDVLQETFLSAWEHLQEFRGDSSFPAWLARIAVHQALMKVPEQQMEASVSGGDSAEGEDPFVPRELREWKADPRLVLSQAELQEILQQAMETLTPRLRAVFLLRDVEGFSTEECGELLGQTPLAIRTGLHRARLQLREELSRTFAR